MRVVDAEFDEVESLEVFAELFLGGLRCFASLGESFTNAKTEALVRFAASADDHERDRLGILPLIRGSRSSDR